MYPFRPKEKAGVITLICGPWRPRQNRSIPRHGPACLVCWAVAPVSHGGRFPIRQDRNPCTCEPSQSHPFEVMVVSVPKTPSVGFANLGESEHDCWMFAIAFLFARVLYDCFKSRRCLEAEMLVLRHQLNVLQLRTPRRLYLTWADRALFVWFYRGFPRILDAITILRPETIVRWHRKGFSAFWRFPDWSSSWTRRRDLSYSKAVE